MKSFLGISSLALAFALALMTPSVSGLQKETHIEDRELTETDPWFLNYTYKIAANYADGDSPELQLWYDIHEDRSNDIRVQLFESDCTLAPENGEVTIAALERDPDEDPTNLPNVTAYKLSINIDEKKIYDSPFWESKLTSGSNLVGKVKLCVKVQLMAGEEAVSFSLLKVIIPTVLTSDYKVESINIKAAEILDLEECATVRYKLNACHCSGEDHRCLPWFASVSKNSAFNICIRPWDPDEVKIAKVWSMRIYQDRYHGLKWPFDTVREPVRLGMNDTLTSVTYEEPRAFIETRATSVIFANKNPGPMYITGECLLEFTQSEKRRLVMTEFTLPVSDPADDTRFLQEEGDSPEDEPYSLTIRLDTESSREDDEKDSGFSAAAIGGVIAGVAVVFVAAVVTLALSLRRRNNKTKTLEKAEETGSMESDSTSNIDDEEFKKRGVVAFV